MELESSGDCWGGDSESFLALGVVNGHLNEERRDPS